MSTIETFEISEATVKYADQFYELYKEGRVFGDDKHVQQTCEVYLASNQLAAEFGKDLAIAAKGEPIAPPSIDILYNLKVQIVQEVAPGHCAIGYYDFSRKLSYYVGMRACR